METIEDIDLSVPGSSSLIMRDLSEYATLPFLAAFDVQALPKSQTPQKRITYIAISKKTMPMLVELFLKFKGKAEIYGDGTLEAVLSVGLFHMKPIPLLTIMDPSGVFDTCQVEVRLPSSLEAWQGPSIMEDRHHKFFTNSKGILHANKFIRCR